MGEQDDRGPRFDDSELATVVASVRGRRLAAVGPWTATSLAPGVASATVGVWRVRGEGWSIVLKVVGHSDRGHENWRSGEAVSHWYYWRREALAYTSGLLGSLTGGLRAPRCHLAVSDRGQRVRLWLEDVSGHPGPDWSLDRFGLAARHLGRAQGAFLAGRQLPSAPWLSRGWLRSYLRQRNRDGGLIDDARAWAAPEIAAAFPTPPAARLRRLWAGRRRILDELEAMPLTLCHLDLHPANLFAVEDGTALIDWSFVGLGAIGEDAGNLVADSVLDFHVPGERISDLWERVAGGYATGLAEAGWRGDEALARRTMALAVTLKYAWILPALLRAARDRHARLNGRPLGEALRWWVPAARFLLELGDREVFS